MRPHLSAALSVATVAAFALAVIACETDTFEPPDQGPCVVTNDCPVGYVCEDELCILESRADASSTADAGEVADADGSGEGSGGG